MRTTLNLDDALLEDARRLTGLEERTALIHEGLRALVQRRAEMGRGIGWLDVHLLASADSAISRSPTPSIHSASCPLHVSLHSR